VPEGIDGFIGAMDLNRGDEVRLRTRFGDKEVHLNPGKGNIDSDQVFKKIEQVIEATPMIVLGALRDMVEAREDLTACAQVAGVA